MTDIRAKAEVVTGASFWATANQPELGAPELILTDGPHGLRRQVAADDHLGLNESVPATCFPPAVGLGASWDADLLREVGRTVGLEARANGVSVLLGPGVNLKRTPLCGRNFEYFSEDPLISGVLGAAHVEGVQSQGVGASVKHFAANNQETGRMQVSAEVDDRTLRELYLSAFERVVKQANPATVMCAYNRINGVFAAENPWLLNEVLRDEWGYAGLVVSDWGAVHDRVEALKAGLDLAMPGPRPEFVDAVVAAVAAGELDEAVLDRAVARVGRLATVEPGHREPVDADAHHEIARAVAADCIVLLRNSGDVLPLAAGRVAVIGPFAETARYQGGGSSHVNPARLDSPLAELRTVAAAHDATIDFDPGTELEPAVATAQGADVAVIFLGLGEADESEGFDREAMDLPADQLVLAKAVAATGTPTVVVLSHGGTVLLEGWHDDVAAIVDASLLGQGGGRAIARMLFGEVNPSGRLTETIPLRLQDNPAWLNFPGEAGVVRYGEGVLVGYRYFTTAGTGVRYPFGHGLSYTTFTTELIEVRATSAISATAKVRVTNTGDRSGKQVVQLYVGTKAGKVRRPLRELRAFTKVALEPGASIEVSVELDHRAFAFWDVTNHRWTVAAGEYRIELGESAAEIVDAGSITLDGDAPVVRLTLESPLEDWLAHPLVGPALLQLLPAELGIDLRMLDSAPVGTLAAMFGFPPAELERLATLQDG